MQDVLALEGWYVPFLQAWQEPFSTKVPGGQSKQPSETFELYPALQAWQVPFCTKVPGGQSKQPSSTFELYPALQASQVPFSTKVPGGQSKQPSSTFELYPALQASQVPFSTKVPGGQSKQPSWTFELYPLAHGWQMVELIDKVLEVPAGQEMHVVFSVLESGKVLAEQSKQVERSSLAIESKAHGLQSLKMKPFRYPNLHLVFQSQRLPDGVVAFTQRAH
jgi:hypothetical protein